MSSEHRQKQRLWVVTECYGPEIDLTGQYLIQAAKGLTDEFDLQVICGGVSMFWESLRNFRKGDRILVSTAPLFLPFTTAIASLIKGCSYTLLIHDFYPDHLVTLGKLKQNSVGVKAMHFSNAWLFKHAARIIAVGPDMAELVSARTDGLGVPIRTIPNWAETGELLDAGSTAETKYTLDVALEQYRAALR